MELLAPAGGWEQLRAAIAFGADAVYLAADKFGMRARAANFPYSEIPAVVAYAHERGVKVHVTCNIMMHESDIAELPEFFTGLADAGVDAFIISDLGAAAVAHACAPQVDIHVSTQASVCNSEAARVWYELGAKRIVCAREMSLEQIAQFKREIPSELQVEVFVHGAMCMAVSGRCLISAYLTGRSGNKGHCTQPCRWHYQLEDASADTTGACDSSRPQTDQLNRAFTLLEDKRPDQHFPIEEDDNGTYIMNAKDLNMLAHLDELAAAGVDSIKIEGRNKKAFYVASVVNAYRNVLDGGSVEVFERELLDVSHRPYNTGFYFGPAQQADDYDGYEQETLHVADILEWCMGADGKTTVRAMCRNRFAEGDTLEVLVPHVAPFEVTVRGLMWLGEASADGKRPAPVAAAVANRATNEYTFTVESNKAAGDVRTACDDPLNGTEAELHAAGPADGLSMIGFLRMRIHRRSSRSGQE